MTASALHLAEASLVVVGEGGSTDSIQSAAEEEQDGMPTAPGRSASALRPRHSTEEERGERTKWVGVSDRDLPPRLSQSVTDTSTFRFVSCLPSSSVINSDAEHVRD